MSAQPPVARLLDVAGSAIGLPAGDLPEDERRAIADHWPALMRLLELRNGFLAFESALHVRSLEGRSGYVGLLEWNEESGWRRHYETVPNNALFFAEDVFANQFAIGPQGVGRLNPETGNYKAHSPTLDAWAELILRDYNFETGWKLAHEWQTAHRALKLGERLLPRQPFVLGGEFETENLMAVPSGDAMERLGRLYQTIRNVPDGTRVALDFWFDAPAE